MKESRVLVAVKGGHAASVLSTALLSVVALTAGCGKAADSPKQRPDAAPVSVTLCPVEHRGVVRTIDVVGTLLGDEQATISAKVPGRIGRITKDLGDRAGAGEVLAEIDTTDYELALDQAKMSLLQTLAKLGLSEMPAADFKPDLVPTVKQAAVQEANAQARFGRAEKLFKHDPPLISEQDYADLKTAWDVARSARDVAALNATALVAEARTRQSDIRVQERKIADATVRAPGVAGGSGEASLRYGVSARLVSAGEYVKEGTAMFRVVADDVIRFRATVPERYLPHVVEGQKVTVRVEAYDQPFTGVVKRINPEVDPASRNFEVEISIANPDRKLRAGSFARGAVETKTAPSVAFVPSSSLVTFAGVKKIFTVAGGKAVEQEVATGVRQGDLVEIVGGVKASQVVATGAERLAAGVPVIVTSGSATRP